MEEERISGGKERKRKNGDKKEKVNQKVEGKGERKENGMGKGEGRKEKSERRR